MAPPIILHLDNGSKVGVYCDSQERGGDHDHTCPIEPITASTDKWCSDDVDSFNKEDIAVVLSANLCYVLRLASLHGTLACCVQYQTDPGCRQAKTVIVQALTCQHNC